MEEKKLAMPVASLVLGIISILTSLFWYLTLPTGVLAIVFGVKSIRKVGSRLAKAGLILGIIGLSLFVLVYIGFTITLLINL